MHKVRYICSVDVLENDKKIHGLKINVFNDSEFKTHESLKNAAFDRARELLVYCGIQNQEFQLELREWKQIRPIKQRLIMS